MCSYAGEENPAGYEEESYCKSTCNPTKYEAFAVRLVTSYALHVLCMPTAIYKTNYEYRNSDDEGRQRATDDY